MTCGGGGTGTSPSKHNTQARASHVIKHQDALRNANICVLSYRTGSKINHR